MAFNFIVLSNQAFDLPLKTNKWHVSNHLAKKGNNVLFLDPPVRYKSLKKFLIHPSWNLLKLFSSLEYINDYLTIYSQTNLFNFFPFSSINTLIHTNILKRFIREKFNPEFKTVLYIYHFDFPDLEEFIKKIPHDLLVYDCVDEYSEFPEYSHKKILNTGIVSLIQRFDDALKIKLNQNGLSGREWVNFREKYLVEKAGLVFASAPGLVIKLSKYKSDVHFLPNAAEAKLFDINKADTNEPLDIQSITHPRIGFSGAIDAYKNDIKLIERSAETYPDFQFILIGPEKVSDPDLDLTKLKSMKNVHFLGLKQWEEMPAYFVNFDAYFIPYNLNDYTVKGCFPVKYFEALAAGLPTVVTNLPAYENFDIDGYVSKSDEDSIANLKRAIDENSDQKIQKRKDLASQNTWDGKTEKILALVNKYFNG